jgi:hypothetical protein
MRKLIAASSLLLVFAACASQRDNATAQLAKPQIDLVQTSGVPTAARHVQGGMNIHYAARIANRAAEPITLKRITVQSMSEGAYNVGPHSVPFNVEIGPDNYHDVEFWAPARTGQSIVGADGPVMLRVTAEFDSPVGKFQEVLTRVVNERASGSGNQ